MLNYRYCINLRNCSNPFHSGTFRPILGYECFACDVYGKEMKSYHKSIQCASDCVLM